MLKPDETNVRIVARDDDPYFQVVWSCKLCGATITNRAIGSGEDLLRIARTDALELVEHTCDI
jgi:hypothetical protein